MIIMTIMTIMKELEDLYSDIIEEKVKKYHKKYGFNMYCEGEGFVSHNNEADAFKHTFLQADLTLRFGVNVAKYLGDKHESDNTGNNSGEMNMDFWNNNIGRRIGLKIRLRHINMSVIEFFILANFGYFDDEIAKEVMKVMRNKEIITSPDDKREYPKDFIIQEKQKRDAQLRRIEIFLLILKLIYNNPRPILTSINKINNKPLGFNTPQPVMNNNMYYTPQMHAYEIPNTGMVTGLSHIYDSENAIAEAAKLEARKVAFEKVFGSDNKKDIPLPSQNVTEGNNISFVQNNPLKPVKTVQNLQYFTPNPKVELNQVPVTPILIQPMGINNQQQQNSSTDMLGGLLNSLLKRQLG